jgi:hypothetical protein
MHPSEAARGGAVISVNRHRQWAFLLSATRAALIGFLAPASQRRDLGYWPNQCRIALLPSAGAGTLWRLRQTAVPLDRILLMALSLSLGLLLLDRLVGSGMPAAMRECPGVAGGR